jgi:MYXO-CTERM domain-containing protein
MLAAGLGLAMTGLVANDAFATRFTETANFWVTENQFNDPPPINLIELSGLSGQGGLFTNTFGFGMVPGQVQINTVGANIIGSGTAPGDISVPGLKSPINLGTATTDNLVVIYALTGTATPLSATSAAATYSAGKAFVISHDPGNPPAPGTTPFVASDPRTWQWNNLLGAGGANVLAIYDLATQEAVATGANGDDVGSPPDFTIPATDTNFSNINLQSNDLTQGIFLFDYEADGPGLALGLPPGPFQVNTPPLTGKPNTEGLVVFGDNSNVVAETIVQTELDVLNSIMQAAVGANFASGLGAAFSDYNPLGQQGDFYNEVGINANPTSQAEVPEPASLALGLMGVAGLAIRRRRMA